MRIPLSLRVSNAVGYVGLIAINVAASRGWLGPTNEKLSKKNHTPITPAGWAFSIWGLIFMLQGFAVVYQLLDYGSSASNKVLVVEAIGYWWIVGWAAECAWQIFFQQQTPWAMWVCAGCLIAGFLSFARALHNIYELCAERGQLSPVLYAAYYLPTSINTAWLSVASCIGVLIVANVLETPRREYGAVLLAAGTTAAGFFLVLTRFDIAYGCTLVWALAAVAAKQERVPVGIAALLCIAVSLVGIVLSVVRQVSRRRQGGLYSEL